jgi:hypothetical protein
MNIGANAGYSGVTITNGNQINFAYTGLYNIQYSVQFVNTDTGTGNDNVDIWIRKNGVDVPYSNSIFNIPNNKAGTNGALIAVRSGLRYPAINADDPAREAEDNLHPLFDQAFTQYLGTGTFHNAPI